MTLVDRWQQAVMNNYGTPPMALKERAVPRKPVRTVLTDKMHYDVVVVKFREGTRVRARSDQWAVDAANLSASENLLL